MPTSLKGLRVFIATPGDLDTIRACFHKVITAYNEADAIRRGVIFLPVAWKDAFGGRGRAQALINRELQTCDYFVMVLHDRWGTPTGALSPAGRPLRSGTEEEYVIAKGLHEAGSMVDMLVFFRAVDQRQRADPGEQLSQVLSFRQDLEAEHSLSYLTFEQDEEFADELRRHLAKWLRDFEAGESGQDAPAAPIAAAAAEALPDLESSSPLERAAVLIQTAKFTEAETLLAGLTASDDDANAAVAYAELLARLSQRHQAEAMFGRAIELAEAQSNDSVHARALVGIARLHEAKHRWADVSKALRAAIVLFERLGDVHGLADAQIRSGEFFRNQSNDEKARAAYEGALATVEGQNLPALAARAQSGLGELLREEERWVEAQAALSLAIDLKQAAGDSDLADLHASLGNALEGAGDFKGAEAKFRESLMAFEASGKDAGIADAADHLGQVCLAQGKLDDAEDAFEKSAVTFESLQLFDAAADAYLSLARVQEGLGKLQDAEASFKNALALTDRRIDADLGEARDEIFKGLEAVFSKQQAAARSGQPPA